MQQLVTDYLDAIRVLATDLNMGRIYDAALYDSIRCISTTGIYS
jgi:hypothetical protein